MFDATLYTCAIDVWSVGCVMGELLLGKPLFPGDSGVDQLIELVKILGTPSLEQIRRMNPDHPTLSTFKFPTIKPMPWKDVFKRSNAAAVAVGAETIAEAVAEVSAAVADVGAAADAKADGASSTSALSAPSPSPLSPPGRGTAAATAAPVVLGAILR